MLATHKSKSIFAALMLFAGAAHGTTTYWVTHTGNSGPGSFAQALADLQLQPNDTQEIRFSLPFGQSNVIYLSDPPPALFGAEVLIDGSDTSGGVVIDGAGQQILHVEASMRMVSLSVANLTLRHGQVLGKGGCLGVDHTTTTTTLDHVTFFECRAYLDASTPARGGAVYSAGPLTVQDSIFDSNSINTLGASAETTDASGGALFSDGAHNVTIARSVFRNNRVYLFNSLPSFCHSGTGGAAGLYLTGVAAVGNISDSTFTGNVVTCRRPGTDYDLDGSGDGGAMNLGSDSGTYNFNANFFESNSGLRGGALAFINAFQTHVNLTNNTFHLNYASASGGAVGFVNCCYANITNNTFSADSTGANVYGAELELNLGSAAIWNNILNNTDPDSPGCDYYFGQLTGGYNLYSTGSCPIPNDTTSSTLGAMPWLQSPRNIGGYVLSMPPSYGSPAIDTGDNTHCPLYDVRGIVRPLDGNSDGIYRCDVGAVESSLVDRLFKNGFD